MNVEYSFCKLFTILSFLIFAQNCAFASANNVESDQPTLAKVLLSYLKAPWINFNSSWADEVTPKCKNDIETLFKAAEAGELWAFQMLDATSKIPAGILTGNIRDLGMYDQCIAVKAHKNRAGIQGRHCMVSLAMPTKFVESVSEAMLVQKISLYNPSADVDFSLTGSVCLPSSCGVADVIGYVNSSIQSSPDLVTFEVNIAQVTCSDLETREDFSMGKILTGGLFAVIICLLLGCTICDFVIRARPNTKFTGALETAAEFSLYANMIKLWSTKTGPDTMRAIHGIRFLTTCAVLAGHRGASTVTIPSVNLSMAIDLRQTALSTIVEMVSYMVETFFVMSGFLTAYYFLKALREGQKINMIMVYVYRYLRLTPCVIIVMLFTMYLLPSMGSGPMWETVIDIMAGGCRKNWWTNLLYVQNFVNKEEMCLIHTWYLAVEMQLFLAVPFILYPIFYRPKLGLAFLGLLSIAAFTIPTVLVAVHQWAALFKFNLSLMPAYYEFLSAYIPTYNRALAYLIGLFLGYDVVNNKRRFTENQLIGCWILTSLLVIVSSWSAYHIQPHATTFDLAGEIIFVSIGRLSWCLAVVWFLYASTQGYGGIMTRFLSLSIFVPLSRMSYSIYLIHLVLQLAVNATEHTAEYISPFGISYLMWGDLVVSIAMAFVLTLCIESPVITLARILRNRVSSPITFSSCDPPREPKGLSEIVKEYLDRTRGKVIPDMAVEWTTGEIKLRGTAFEVPETNPGNGKPKTPAEWAKIWQDWKSHLLKNDDREPETCVEDARNEHLQSRTEIPASENEWLIFLAGVSCGLDEAPSAESELSVGKKP